MRLPIHIGLVMLPASFDIRRKLPLPAASIHRCPAVPPRYRFQRAGSAVLRPMTIALPGPNARWLTWPSGIISGNPAVDRAA